MPVCSALHKTGNSFANGYFSPIAASQLSENFGSTVCCLCLGVHLRSTHPACNSGQSRFCRAASGEICPHSTSTSSIPTIPASTSAFTNMHICPLLLSCASSSPVHMCHCSNPPSSVEINPHLEPFRRLTHCHHAPAVQHNLHQCHRKQQHQLHSPEQEQPANYTFCPGSSAAIADLDAYSELSHRPSSQDDDGLSGLESPLPSGTAFDAASVVVAPTSDLAFPVGQLVLARERRRSFSTPEGVALLNASTESGTIASPLFTACFRPTPQANTTATTVSLSASIAGQVHYDGVYPQLVKSTDAHLLPGHSIAELPAHTLFSSSCFNSSSSSSSASPSPPSASSCLFAPSETTRHKHSPDPTIGHPIPTAPVPASVPSSVLLSSLSPPALINSPSESCIGMHILRRRDRHHQLSGPPPASATTAFKTETSSTLLPPLDSLGTSVSWASSSCSCVCSAVKAGSGVWPGTVGSGCEQIACDVAKPRLNKCPDFHSCIACDSGQIYACPSCSAAVTGLAKPIHYLQTNLQCRQTQSHSQSREEHRQPNETVLNLRHSSRSTSAVQPLCSSHSQRVSEKANESPQADASEVPLCSPSKRCPGLMQTTIFPRVYATLDAVGRGDGVTSPLMACSHVQLHHPHHHHHPHWNHPRCPHRPYQEVREAEMKLQEAEAVIATANAALPLRRPVSKAGAGPSKVPQSTMSAATSATAPLGGAFWPVSPYLSMPFHHMAASTTVQTKLPMVRRKTRFLTIS
ncbi:unnamed protein product [Protopolystoma xenopodis]|uniref:Uncharacterized protein n=1 Tax=Protopolystoma xenopodis TaxID=117903 RepID=A0A448XFZ0_9PLAT|nr:unnamed protein product [Protopolystoma xenopodis]